MSRYEDMSGHRDNISLGDDHIIRIELVVDLSDISHTGETRWAKLNENIFRFVHIVINN